LDEDSVEAVREMCAKLIEQRCELSLEEVTSILKEKFITDQTITSAHIREILQTLVYDGEVRLACKLDPQHS
jgi:hypothetical protein